MLIIFPYPTLIVTDVEGLITNNAVSYDFNDLFTASPATTASLNVYIKGHPDTLISLIFESIFMSLPTIR